MDEKQMLLTMINMQKELDKAILESKGLEWNNSKCNIENLQLALLDEIGELTHELKSEWCWWKATQPKVDRERVLEELVDIWHFAMAWLYRDVGNGSVEIVAETILDDSLDYSSYLDTFKMTLVLAVELRYEAFSFMKFLILFSRSLGFQIEDVYNAYIKKNKVNYERLKTGY